MNNQCQITDYFAVSFRSMQQLVTCIDIVGSLESPNEQDCDWPSDSRTEYIISMPNVNQKSDCHKAIGD